MGDVIPTSIAVRSDVIPTPTVVRSGGILPSINEVTIRVIYLGQGISYKKGINAVLCHVFDGRY